MTRAELSRLDKEELVVKCLEIEVDRSTTAALNKSQEKEIKNLNREIEDLKHENWALSTRIKGLEYGLTLAQQQAYRNTKQLRFYEKGGGDRLALASGESDDQSEWRFVSSPNH